MPFLDMKIYLNKSNFLQNVYSVLLNYISIPCHTLSVCYVMKRSKAVVPHLLAPGTGFAEDNFSTYGVGGMVSR